MLILLIGGCMAVITFDTLEYAKNLEENGFTSKQAETLANENKRVFNEFAETQLATKSDLFTVKEELKTDLFTVKEELKTDIRLLHWGIGLLIIVVGIPTLKALFS